MNNKECYENPFVYGLINTPVNTNDWWKGSTEDELIENFADAFKFIWSELDDEFEYDCYEMTERVFDELCRSNRRNYREADFQYPAQALADLFSYSEGEAFYI